MPWIVADKKDLNNILSYLLADEPISIQSLSNFIDKNGKYYYPGLTKAIPIIKKENNSVAGIILITSKGLIYPHFSDDTIVNINEKRELIKIMATISVIIHGVIGLKEHVEFLDSVIFRRLRGKINYLFMHREGKTYYKLNESFHFKNANIKDLNKLVPLEIEYQKEEVILNPIDLNKKATIENLKYKIVNKNVYFHEINKFPLTKAGTTYRSSNYVLIGGVFTWKEKRNNGLSTELLKHLINNQLQRGYKAALFVKSENMAAIHIYKKLGFINPRPYQINYYHR